MKKLLLISLFAGVLPLSMTAQVDDLYFVPKKKSVEKVTDHYGMPKDVYYSGSNRSVDEYNRRTISHYEPIGADSILNDTIQFIAEKGVYPDSTVTEDFNLTKQMSRFDDYDMSDNDAFWEGYRAGRYDWAWHSPWYYSRFGWYDPWYDPWYYSRWGWYNPFYYSWYGGWYGGWYGSWYDPWYYNHWNYGGYYWSGGGRGYYHAPTIGGGTIRRDGTTYGSRNSSIARNSSRMNELRNRTVSGNSRNGNYSRNSNGYRNNNSSFNGSRSGSNSSFSGSRSSGGGSFSSGGGSRGGGGGGGSRMGGRR